MSRRALQRDCDCDGQPEGECEECKRPNLQRSNAAGVASGGARLRPSLVTAIEAARGGGQPLGDATRERLSPALGDSLDRVRVHDDARAASLASTVSARAFTVGDDVFFALGQYRPGSANGDALIAHEVVHTVQQRGGSSTGPLTISDSADRFEREASGIAAALDTSAPGHAAAPAAQSVGWLMRAPATDTQPGGTDLSSGQAVNDTQGPSTEVGVQASMLGLGLLFGLRIPLPKPVPLCGKTLTHVEIPGPPRWRDLEPCLPKGVPVFRLNILGRDTTVSATGSQVFNLHIGVYRDPATNRLCGILDDSKACLVSRCVKLGCFPTLQEVLEAIKTALLAAIAALGLKAFLEWLASIWPEIVEVLEGLLVFAEATPGGGAAPPGEQTPTNQSPLSVA